VLETHLQASEISATISHAVMLSANATIIPFDSNPFARRTIHWTDVSDGTYVFVLI